MYPMISNLNSKSEQIEIISNDFRREKQLIQLRKYVEKNFDFVGKDFCKKVREIYYDKKNKKAIYGTATDEERRIWPMKALIYYLFLGLIRKTSSSNYK